MNHSIVIIFYFHPQTYNKKYYQTMLLHIVKYYVRTLFDVTVYYKFGEKNKILLKLTEYSINVYTNTTCYVYSNMKECSEAAFVNHLNLLLTKINLLTNTVKDVTSI